MTVIHNTAQNSSDSFRSYPSDNHRSSDDVYWREREYEQEVSLTCLRHMLRNSWKLQEMNFCFGWA